MRACTQVCYTLNFTAGKTTYLDTPVLPVAAFVVPTDWQLDGNYPSGTPVIMEASIMPVLGNGNGNGPYIASGWSARPDPSAAGTVRCRILRYPRPALTTRDFGFGNSAWTRASDGVVMPAANVTWADAHDHVNVPAHGAIHTRPDRWRSCRGHGVRSGAWHHTSSSGAAGTVVTSGCRRRHPGGDRCAPAGGVVLVRLASTTRA